MARGECLRPLFLVLALGSCQQATQVQTWAVDDLLAAEADARAHHDVTALCWAGLRWFAQAKVIGLASSMQLVRDLFYDQALRNSCAPLALDVMTARAAALPGLLALPTVR